MCVLNIFEHMGKRIGQCNDPFVSNKAAKIGTCKVDDAVLFFFFSSCFSFLVVQMVSRGGNALNLMSCVFFFYYFFLSFCSEHITLRITRGHYKGLLWI